MTTPIVYIAGPMTGLPEYNYPAFNDAATTLRAAGFEVLNPAENEKPGHAPTWADWLRLSIAQVIRADIVVTLPGWHKSRGARLEIDIADRLSLPVGSVGQILDNARTIFAAAAAGTKCDACGGIDPDCASCELATTGRN